jgi:hypothetical protein
MITIRESEPSNGFCWLCPDILPCRTVPCAFGCAPSPRARRSIFLLDSFACGPDIISCSRSSGCPLPRRNRRLHSGLLVGGPWSFGEQPCSRYWGRPARRGWGLHLLSWSSFDCNLCRTCLFCFQISFESGRPQTLDPYGDHSTSRPSHRPFTVSFRSAPGKAGLVVLQLFASARGL